MSLLIETIRIYNGKVYNIGVHEERCNKARRVLFNCDEYIKLRMLIKIPDNLKKGLVKCRIIYDTKVRDVLYEPYSIKDVKTVSLVNIDRDCMYEYKYLNRPILDTYKSLYPYADEIIMLKEGLVTDAFYYNIVLKIDGKLLTPKKPLLKGTMRQKLLNANRIECATLTSNDLKIADKVFLINAMTSLGKIEVKNNLIF